MKVSKPNRGDENLDIVLAYLRDLKAMGGQFPLRRCKPDIRTISEITGLDRQVFYRNKRIMKAIKDFVSGNSESLDRQTFSCKDCDTLKRKYELLQERYVECDTERRELRRRFMQEEAAEEVLENGRRWIP